MEEEQSATIKRQVAKQRKVLEEIKALFERPLLTVDIATGAVLIDRTDSLFGR